MAAVFIMRRGSNPSEPFTGFTGLKNKGNPASEPFTTVNGCDGETFNDFNEVNGVKGQNPPRGAI